MKPLSSSVFLFEIRCCNSSRDIGLLLISLGMSNLQESVVQTICVGVSWVFPSLHKGQVPSDSWFTDCGVKSEEVLETEIPSFVIETVAVYSLSLWPKKPCRFSIFVSLNNLETVLRSKYLPEESFQIIKSHCSHL